TVHRLTMHTLKRVLTLWRVYAFLDFQLLTRSLTLFLTWYITDAVIHFSAIAAVLLIAERFEGIGAWTKPQLIFMLGYATIVNGLLDMFFGYNILFISRRIGRGQLDHTLIQPQPLWSALLTEGFSPIEGSGTLFVGSALLAWSIANLQVPVSALWLVLLLVNLVASAVVVLAFSFAVGSLAFWAPRAAEEISTPLIRMFAHLKQFPFDGLSSLMLGVVTVVPVGFMAWYPSRGLLGLDPSPWATLATVLVALLMAGFARLMFLKGMGHYAHTGSSRYHALGHRS
ncbi:MAG: ABC transporter permease, partial [Chloroflexi bacterium]|nr:ABC transporter permease [Chloroflexota bacterium]